MIVGEKPSDMANAYHETPLLYLEIKKTCKPSVPRLFEGDVECVKKRQN